MPMNVALYEKIWMYAAGFLIVVFLGGIFLMAGLHAVQPPSHFETVDPERLGEHPEFSNPQVRVEADGRIVVPVVAQMFAFSPDTIEVPAGRPIVFRLTSADVMHGFQVVGTNANAMAVPGYISKFTITFETPGDYLVACNEYCGTMHHNMVGRVVVKDGATEELP
jgi:cytochrome c oxidase subunit 2